MSPSSDGLDFRPQFNGSSGSEWSGLPGICEIVFLKFSVIMPQRMVATNKRAILGVFSGKEILGKSLG